MEPDFTAKMYCIWLKDASGSIKWLNPQGHKHEVLNPLLCGYGLDFSCVLWYVYVNDIIHILLIIIWQLLTIIYYAILSNLFPRWFCWFLGIFYKKKFRIIQWNILCVQHHLTNFICYIYYKNIRIYWFEKHVALQEINVKIFLKNTGDA